MGGEPKDLGLDGLFKLLTWRSLAISRVFGLPDIVGEPLQQEFQFPRERRVDRLYRLADGSLLNIEHQSSLADREALQFLPEEEATARLAASSSEETLMDMAGALPEMTDVDAFFKRFGVDLSSSTGEPN